MRLILALSCLVLAANGEDEYEYDTDYDPKAIKSKGGHRLVGAKAAKHQTINFLVAWNVAAGDKHDFSACTGSLITPLWMVSAAHCDTLIEHYQQEECIQETETNGQYTIRAKGSNRVKGVVKCRARMENAIEIYPVDPVAKAWMGVDNMMTKQEDSTFETLIKKVILHAKSYRPGGSYGTFGGYDITLANFVSPVPPNIGKPACLPTPTFKDQGIEVKLAGYGKYVRDTCQTDEYSPYKFHYCKGQSRYGDGKELCKTTPAPQSDACAKFFKTQRLTNKDWTEHEVILEGSNGRQEYCYHSESLNSESRGWCEVEEDFYNTEPTTVGKNAWGFCGKDCYLADNGKVQESNVLREATAYSLDHEICEEYLETSAKNVEVHPEILCIGYYNKFNFTVYKDEGGGRYSKMDPSSVKHFGQRLDEFGVDGFVTSAGTCNGDSGGPAFVEEEKGRFVVLGAVSGGRGRMGRCGGINNPVHYTRLSRFAIWIVKMIGKPEVLNLCWHRSFEERMKAKAPSQRRRV